MDCKLAVSFIHEYLDGDLPDEQANELKQHMAECSECRAVFKELEQTELLMFAVNHRKPPVSDELTDRIMQALPKKKQPHAWTTWLKRHPALTAAAAFFVILLGTLPFWNEGPEMIVKGQNLDQVVIEGNTVIVPEGKTIAGNLTIEKGQARIYGDVEGNVTVIDGSIFQASTAHISGQVQTVDQAVGWLWYKISTAFSEVASTN
ncbi:zf-HC2 domain-containing protein [Paenibacillus wulumuqiensis]|uniref:zf-HC2 domain-containing protein n=1 Tax=Paenibacillus wulumuqiensis TaxID=1567107 RepID=UPI0006198912|nr:zf-HC2 domain-containing protein [Paenibacillus wulumuqiensis]